MHQGNTSHAWTFQGCNLKQLLLFKALRVGRQVHQSTSQTPPTHGRSMYAIQNNSSFLGLNELVNECTSPPVEHLPRVDNPCMQSGTTPCYRALCSCSTRLFQVPMRGRSMYAIRNNSSFLGLLRVGQQDSSKFPRVDNPCMQSGTTPCF